MLENRIKQQLNEFISEGEAFQFGLEEKRLSKDFHPKYLAYRTSCLAFIKRLLGDSHEFYISYYIVVRDGYFKNHLIVESIEILKRIQQAIDFGWIDSIKGIISAEIFSDFLEMADHLLEEGYKDSAAVMIGSVLEEHIRNLCQKNGILTTTPDKKTGKAIPKKADLMNTELCQKKVYNGLEQKSVTSWLDLRNKAAHGKYTEYDLSQVVNLLNNVKDFIVRNPL